MGVRIVNTGVGNGIAANATSNSLTITCPPDTDCLLVAEGGAATSGLNSMTVNGVPITPVRDAFNNGFGQEVSLWYLKNPPTGIALTVTANYSITVGQSSIIAIPLMGTDNLPIGVPQIITFATGAGTAVLPASGAAPGDLYLGITASSTSVAIAGTGQVLVRQTSSRGTFFLEVDEIIPTGSPVNFSWTQGANWNAMAVIVSAQLVAADVAAPTPQFRNRRRPAGMAMDLTAAEWW